MNIRLKNQHQSEALNESSNLIIDTHGGLQDILAIIFSLKAAKKQGKNIIAITCTSGRRPVADAATDALLAVKLSGCEVPIYKGPTQSILLNQQYPVCHNFNQNFDELDKFKQKILCKADLSMIKSEFAPIYIGKQIKRLQKDLAIVIFGPLTNLALAFHRNTNENVIGSIMVNGGSYTGIGNIKGRNTIDGNFRFDPEAAHIVISNYQNIYINPLQQTLETNFDKVFSQILKKQSLDKQLKEFMQLFKSKIIFCGPLLTIAPFFSNSQKLLTSYIVVYSEIILDSQQLKGMMTSNWLRLDVKKGQQSPNTKFYFKIDHSELNKIVLDVI